MSVSTGGDNEAGNGPDGDDEASPAHAACAPGALDRPLGLIEAVRHVGGVRGTRKGHRKHDRNAPILDIGVHLHGLGLDHLDRLVLLQHESRHLPVRAR